MPLAMRADKHDDALRHHLLLVDRLLDQLHAGPHLAAAGRPVPDLLGSQTGGPPMALAADFMAAGLLAMGRNAEVFALPGVGRLRDLLRLLGQPADFVVHARP